MPMSITFGAMSRLLGGEKKRKASAVGGRAEASYYGRVRAVR